MSWWSILKSSREEAYAEFVKEYGPEVELDSLRLNAHDDTNQVQIDSPDSEWFITYTILSSGEEQFTFESESKYLKASTQTFVEGMFETEYPERYQELLEMARAALPQEVVNPPTTSPTYQNIVFLIDERIRNLGLLHDTDYTTGHTMPFTAVLEMALEELKDYDWPSPGSPIPRTEPRKKMFEAVLDKFLKIFSMIQRKTISDRNFFRVSGSLSEQSQLMVHHRKQALKRLIESSFIVSEERIGPRDPDSQYLSDVLSIIEVEMNPSGE